MTTFDRVKQVMVDQLDVNGAQLLLTTSFAGDLRLGPGQMAQLLMAFEDEFDFELPHGKDEALFTVGDAVAQIERMTAVGSLA